MVSINSGLLTRVTRTNLFLLHLVLIQTEPRISLPGPKHRDHFSLTLYDSPLTLCTPPYICLLPAGVLLLTSGQLYAVEQIMGEKIESH